MRFMMMVKHAEIQAAPPKELMDAMVKAGEEAAKSGTMIASGGLAPTAASRASVFPTGGECDRRAVHGSQGDRRGIRDV